MAITDIILWGFIFFALYFQVLLLLLTLRRSSSGYVRAEEKSSPLSYYPSVEVVVPCYNEEKTVVATIRSLLALSYPKNKFRITIVNDGSKDGTSRVLKRFRQNPQIQIIEKTNGGKHTAMNRAIETSTAEIIGCLDADSYVRPDALLEMMRVFVDDPVVMAVTPCMKVAPPKTLLSSMQKAEYELGIFLRKIFSDVNSQFVLPGPFSFYRREVFHTIGVFRAAHNTEDLEMALRMQRAGMKIGNAPRAMVYTNTPQRFLPLFKQRVRWAYGFLRNAVDYRVLFFNKNNVFLGFFALPIVFISILMSTYLLFLALYHATASLIMKATEVSVIGLPALIPTLPSTIDWFMFAPTALTYVSLLALFVGITLTLLGKYVGYEPVRIDRGIILYVLCYGLLAPLWLTKAVFDATFLRGNKWR